MISSAATTINQNNAILRHSGKLHKWHRMEYTVLKHKIATRFHATLSLYASLLTRAMGLNRGLAVTGAGQEKIQPVYSFFFFFFYLCASFTPKTLPEPAIYLHRDESAHFEKATGTMRLHSLLHNTCCEVREQNNMRVTLTHQEHPHMQVPSLDKSPGLPQ